MEYRNLGKSGLKVSEVSLGGWVTFGQTVNDQSMVRDIVMKAYEEGVVVRCGDGILRRLFLRLVVYSADYPEKYVPAILPAVPS